MVIRFLHSLLGANGADTPPETVSETVYQGFTIAAAPIQDPGGWRVSGRISGDVGGEQKSVEFVRADVYGSREVAAEMTTLKAKRLIDEQGTRLLGSTP